jgi:hypothetical protein
MKVVSCLAWLSCVSTLRSTFAFTTAISSSHQTTITSKLSNSAVPNKPTTTASSALNMVASSVEAEVVAKMERGVGGRIEEAFAQAKERGEAAFVTFVTAGYPTAAGTYETKEIESMIDCSKLPA